MVWNLGRSHANKKSRLHDENLADILYKFNIGIWD